jgi:hypothetical protein
MIGRDVSLAAPDYDLRKSSGGSSIDPAQLVEGSRGSRVTRLDEGVPQWNHDDLTKRDFGSSTRVSARRISAPAGIAMRLTNVTAHRTPLRSAEAAWSDLHHVGGLAVARLATHAARVLATGRGYGLTQQAQPQARSYPYVRLKQVATACTPWPVGGRLKKGVGSGWAEGLLGVGRCPPR